MHEDARVFQSSALDRNFLEGQITLRERHVRKNENFLLIVLFDRESLAVIAQAETVTDINMRVASLGGSSDRIFGQLGLKVRVFFPLAR